MVDDLEVDVADAFLELADMGARGEAVALVEELEAVIRDRGPGRAGWRMLKVVEAEVDASEDEEGSAASWLVESSMLAGVPERDPVGVGLAWMA